MFSAPSLRFSLGEGLLAHFNTLVCGKCRLLTEFHMDAFGFVSMDRTLRLCCQSSSLWFSAGRGLPAVLQGSETELICSFVFHSRVYRYYDCSSVLLSWHRCICLCAYRVMCQPQCTRAGLLRAFALCMRYFPYFPECGRIDVVMGNRCMDTNWVGDCGLIFARAAFFGLDAVPKFKGQIIIRACLFLMRAMSRGGCGMCSARSLLVGCRSMTGPIQLMRTLSVFG